MNKHYDQAYPVPGAVAGAGYAMDQAKGANRRAPTLRENIEGQILECNNRLLRLQRTQALLSEGRLMDISLDDLHMAMSGGY